jgi:hypothetical protein
MVRLNPRVLTTLYQMSVDIQKMVLVYLRWEERVERASTEVEVLHEAEQPRPRVSTCLSETFHGAHWLARVADTIALHARMCKLTLRWS